METAYDRALRSIQSGNSTQGIAGLDNSVVVDGMQYNMVNGNYVNPIGSVYDAASGKVTTPVATSYSGGGLSSVLDGIGTTAPVQSSISRTGSDPYATASNQNQVPTAAEIDTSLYGTFDAKGNYVQPGTGVNIQTQQPGGLSLTGMETAQVGLGLAGLAATVDAQKFNERMARKNYGLAREQLDMTKADVGYRDDGTTNRSRTKSAMSSAFA